MNNMKFCVLSIEDGIVKLESETGKIDFIKLDEIKKDIFVNDIIEKTESGFIRLTEETENKKSENIKLQQSLWEE